MRHFLRTFAKTLTTLVACLGCSSCGEQPPKPRIRWTGEDTRYHSETPSLPARPPAEAHEPIKEADRP